MTASTQASSTLLLICEEGEEEYDLSVYSPPSNVYLEVIEDQDAL